MTSLNDLLWNNEDEPEENEVSVMSNTHGDDMLQFCMSAFCSNVGGGCILIPIRNLTC